MDKHFGLVTSSLLFLLKPILWLLKVFIYPQTWSTQGRLLHQNSAVVYVLPRESLLDRAVVNKALKQLGFPLIEGPAGPKSFMRCACLALKPRRFLGFINKRQEPFLYDFLRLVKYDERSHSGHMSFVPVTVFWSRAPKRQERGFIIRSFFPDDGHANVVQKLFLALLHRGAVSVVFGRPESGHATEMVRAGNLPQHNIGFAKQMQRRFHIQFAKERNAAFGPQLYNFERMTRSILKNPITQKYIASSENPEQTERNIYSYIQEISANYNYLTIKAMEHLLHFLWNTIFEGVNIHYFESVEALARTGRIVWMPSHRSHFDYLLMAYVLFKRGLVAPHVAAGINLNFWPIGSILRRGGAFFVRRSFSGNRAYAHAFSQYVDFLLQNSFSLEFFQEGGRSRIGKLLPPKTGLLSICVQSILQHKNNETAFIPVYFAYEKVLEDNTYAKELRGAKKQKESIFQFLNGILKVFANYGSVDVAFGRPIRMDWAWQQYVLWSCQQTAVQPQPAPLPERLQDIPEDWDSREPALQNFVKFLGQRINEGINRAVIVSPTALLCAVLLIDKSAHIPLSRLELWLGWLSTAIKHLVALVWNPHQKGLGSCEGPKCDQVSSDPIGLDVFLRIGNRLEFLKPASSDPKLHRAEPLVLKNLQKECNLWWYRGTVFHAFVPISVVCAVLLDPNFACSLGCPDKEGTLQRQFSFVRDLWAKELYWDLEIQDLDMISVVLDYLVSIKAICVGDEKAQLPQLLDPDVVLFFARLIEPEVTLYQGVFGIKSHMPTQSASDVCAALLNKKQRHVLLNSPCATRVDSWELFIKVFFYRAWEAYHPRG